MARQILRLQELEYKITHTVGKDSAARELPRRVGATKKREKQSAWKKMPESGLFG